MNRLIKIGFQNAGFWELDERKANTLQFYLRTDAPYPHTLYAFVLDGVVVYVGKTTRTLRHRLTNYANGLRKGAGPRTDTTNVRIAHLILDALSQEQVVEIYALPDTELHRIGDFHLNLAAGLEDSIINVVKPEWNGGKRAKAAPLAGVATPLPSPPMDHETIRALPVRESIQVKIGTTYLERGFFNTGIQGAQALAGDGETLSIFCGDAEEPILGYINRRANTNRSPRIFGGKSLRDWIQGNLARDAVMQVDVLTPTAIRLSAGHTDDQGRPA